ncbi:unnamed protein product [Sphagnum balticum]
MAWTTKLSIEKLSSHRCWSSPSPIATLSNQLKKIYRSTRPGVTPVSTSLKRHSRRRATSLNHLELSTVQQPKKVGRITNGDRMFMPRIVVSESPKKMVD